MQFAVNDGWGASTSASKSKALRTGETIRLEEREKLYITSP